MSEKRKPELVIVASKRGKRQRLAIYRASLWPKKFPRARWGQYRVRVNGRWWPGPLLTWTEICTKLRKELKP